jgi:hypothetical protein
MTFVIGVAYCDGSLVQLTIWKLSIEREMRRKVGFQPLTIPPMMASAVWSGDDM